MSKSTTILVVDDNLPMARTMLDILEMKGYAVHMANSGAEALKILRRHKVDILLTDVIMPEMNGVELYCKAKEIRPRMVAFLMTAYSADDIIHQGIAAGIRTVLTKPINIDSFLSLVTAVEETYL